ncbi:MAG: hypothetical protein EBZ13_04300, partial [Planctomycetia bacterium]|nr:hypothetical protein [Planctomycetia bacterium]
LAEQVVLDATSDDVDAADPAAHQFIKFTECPPNSGGNTLQRCPNNGTGRFRNRFAHRPSQLADRCWHVCRSNEGRVVRVDQCCQRRGFCRECCELIPGPLLTCPQPAGSTLLDKPKPTDILEQPGCPSHATFVGEVAGEAFRCYEWTVQFGSDECPCAEADITPVRSGRRWLKSRHGSYGTSGIVGAG